MTRLAQRDGTGFVAETADGTIAADNVVVATGPYQRKLVPDLLGDHPVFQVHAAGYKNPEQLPPGAVLVVGAGASGAQIAEELLQAGRRVYLSVGRHRRLPRRYRGRDLIWWLAEMQPRSGHAGGARAGAPGPRHFRRLWRPHHRFPQLRRRRHDPGGTHRGGA